jgi:hypothetical protein
MADKKDDSIQALQDIRNLMDRSARFLTLSGWSGVWAGGVGLAGAAIAWSWLQAYRLGDADTHSIHHLRNRLVLLGVAVLVTAVAGGYFFTLRKVKRQGGVMWNAASRNLLTALALPLAAGGIFILGMLYQNDWTYIAPSCLVFYGLALIHAGKYTVRDIRYLGGLEVLLGGLGVFLPWSGLYLWAAGFGILHILYGIIMWWRYDKRDDR